MNKTSIISILFQAFKLLPKSIKKKTGFVFAFLLLNSVLEVIGLGILIPLFTILLKDNFIHESSFIENIYHTLNFSSESGFIVFITLSVVVFILIKSVVNIWITSFQSKFAFSTYKHFAVCLQKLNYQKGYMHFKDNNTAFLLRDINAMPIYYAQNILLPSLLLFNEIVVISILITTILFFNPTVVLLMSVLIFPITFFTYRYIKKKIKGIGELKSDQATLIYNNLTESVNGYVDVKITNTETYFFEKYKNLVNDFNLTQIKNNVLVSIPPKIIETGTFLGIVGFFIFSYFFIADKSSISIMLGLFAVSAFRILPSVNRILASLFLLKENQFCLNVISQINPKHDYSSYYGKTYTSEKLVFKDEIKISDLNFEYSNGKKILNNISITIKKGETIGIIGKSGSGKTTLINVILRFLKEKSGAIYVDNVRLADENEDSWRRILGYVQQEVYIIDSTLAENIAFGIEYKNIDFDKLNKVITLASLSELVATWPDGFNTKLGERGAKVSGGQRQRIGIARALYFDSEILVFDEATSALDYETEKEITESINKLSEQHLTMIIIAHRYTTLRHCDKIFKMSDGYIINELTYNQIEYNKND